MAAKKRSAVLDYLVCLAVRVLVCVLQAISFQTGCAIARLLAWCVYQIDKRHRLVALDNLQKSFPGRYSGAQADQLVRRVYENFLLTGVEFIHAPRRLHVHNYKRFIYLRNPRLLAEMLLSGRPILFVTGHFGNWELAGFALGLLGFKAHAIARPLDNPYLDDFLRKFRERTGQKLLAKHGDFDQMQNLLRSGGILATLADQDAGQRGLFVDFFGRPASTHKAVALMALEHQVPMIVVGTFRQDGMYQVWPIDAILPESYEKTPDDIKAMTQRFTTGLETLIREAPEQYFWLHRRWKHAPPVRKTKPPLAA